MPLDLLHERLEGLQGRHTHPRGADRPREEQPQPSFDQQIGSVRVPQPESVHTTVWLMGRVSALLGIFSCFSAGRFDFFLFVLNGLLYEG